MERNSINNCIHCHKCRDNCKFLSKYGIDIGDIEKLREHAYGCFLCGTCTDVCPIGIDGREEIMDMRRDRVSSGEQAEIEKAYKGLISEKREYKFRNYKHGNEGTVFFPGCNFPSLYPKTCKEVSRLLAEHGIGTVYDCCGKPVAELGFKNDEDRIIRELNERFESQGITEIVLACPNCRGFFGDRLNVNITSIYTKLQELGLGSKVSADMLMFTPCPDRYKLEWIDEIKPYVDGEITAIEGIQCCGLGGSAMKQEPEIAKSFTDDIKDRVDTDELYTYCASCTGRISRNGFKNIRHILTRVLGTEEMADTGKSYINRMLTKIK